MSVLRTQPGGRTNDTPANCTVGPLVDVVVTAVVGGVVVGSGAAVVTVVSRVDGDPVTGVTTCTDWSRPGVVWAKATPRPANPAVSPAATTTRARRRRRPARRATASKSTGDAGPSTSACSARDTVLSVVLIGALPL